VLTGSTDKPRAEDDPASDAALATRVLAGDRLAFRTLVERFEGTVAGVVHGMLGHDADADDVGQEAMVKLYGALATFRHEASLKTFVTRIAINCCLDHLKKRKRFFRRFRAMDDVLDEAQPDPMDRTARAEERQAVMRAMAGLTPEFRSVVVLRLIEGHSTLETAQILGVAEGTILSRLARARKHLAAQLEGYENG
jgi:RNA polymerase sigma-70 factor (ECF subfamily)